MSQAQLERKVEEYLRNSQALEDYWQGSITADQLQAEMGRMAQHTKRPEILRELFDALGNDAFVIAECLGRPMLLERLQFATVEWRKEPVDSWRARAQNQMPNVVAAATANYTLPAISDPTSGCIDDSWTATSTNNAPTARYGHTAVSTGSEMIVWGGGDNTGGRYCVQAGSPTPTPTPGALQLRAQQKRVGGINTVRLNWRGATSPNIDIYRNNVLIATQSNDPGAYTDSTGDTGRARYRYRVCEAGTQTCSNVVLVTFPQ